MKKNYTASLFGLAATTILMISALCGCAAGASSNEPVAPATESVSQTPEVDGEPTEVAATEDVSDDTPTDEPMVGMPNPWVEITEEEAKELCPRLFKLPDGAEAHEWLKCDDLGDPETNLGSLVQLSFTMDGLEYTARAQYGANEDDDISGLYVDWTAGPDDVTLANWGEGHMAGMTFRSINDTGYVDLITWYDIEIGIKYSLSVAAADLDGFDIQAVAEQMYNPDNEPYTGE